MTKEDQVPLRDRVAAFRSGNKELYSTVRHNLMGGIKLVKAAYKVKIEDHFTSGTLRACGKSMLRMWD